MAAMLEQMIAAARVRVQGLDQAAFEAKTRDLPAVLSLEAALIRPGLGIVAEVKRKSPSRGRLSADLDPAHQSGLYQQGGASAISVLTEPDFFSGSLSDLTAARSAVDIPVVRKDFIIDSAQVWESRAARADAVLLIVAAFDDTLLGHLLAEVAAAGMEALVEVHTADEAKRALAAGARIVGVNNRDLSTFRVDLATAESLADPVAEAPVRVAESGIFTASDAERMARAGYHAVLVGEALVTADDPAQLVAELRGVAD